MANIITIVRILCSIALLFCTALSPEFIVLYLIAGLMLFILPLTLSFVDLKYSAVVVCIAATFAAVQEGHYIRTGKCADRI